jgi:hypothetical protein
MTEVDNLVMEHLRAIRKEVAEVKDGLATPATTSCCAPREP